MPAIADPVHTILTEDEFIDRFQPEEDGEGCLYVQRYPSNPEDRELIDTAKEECRLWTAVDGDDGEFCISSGFHYVNWLYYIICQQPHPENEEFTVQSAD